MTDGKISHLPLIDFHCPASAENARLALAVGRRIIDGSFLLLLSGKSYHAVGLKPILSDELVCFLSKALLFSPIVDRGYIAHQLIERRCALRISKGGHANVIPTVIAVGK